MNRRALITIFLVVLTDLIGFGIVIPLLPQITSELGITGLRLGVLMSAYSIAQLFAAPILGRWSDTIGRKPVLLISKFGTIIAYIILALAGNYWLLLLSRLIDGFTGGNISAARAYISDHTTKENRSRGMAILGISFGLGFILGPAIGGIFFSLSHTKTLPALIGALLCLLSFIFTQIFLVEKVNPDKVKKISRQNPFKVLTNPAIAQIMLLQLIIMTIGSGYQTTLTFFTAKVFNFNPVSNSSLFVYLGILGLITQGFLIRKTFKNNHQVIKIGLILITLALLFISFSPSLIIFYLALAVNSLGGALVSVLLPTILSTVSSTDPEGEIQGVFESIGSLGRIIGPIAIGSIITLYPRPAFAALALLNLTTLLILRYKKSNHFNLTQFQHSQSHQPGDN